MRALIPVVLLGLAVVAPAFALSADEQTAIRRAETRGRLLFALDRAAWVSTDKMLEQKERLAGLNLGRGGWIVEVAPSLLRRE